MNIGISNAGNIFNEVIKYDNTSIVQDSNKNTDLLISASTKEQVDIFELSKDSMLAYDLATRFKESTLDNYEVKLSNKFLIDNNDYDDSFIKDFCIEYYNIKKEMAINCSDTQYKNRMNLVDKVYKDVVNEAAESLSNVFENFFDYSSNMTKFYKMKSDDGIFDKDTFKNHLISLGAKALNTVKNTDKNISIDTLNKNIEKTLETVKGNDLNTMSYKDIKILSNLFKTLPSLRLPLSGHIDKKLVAEKEDIWSKTMENLDNNLSENVKQAVLQSGNKNIKTFDKITNYIEMKDSLQKELEKLKELLSKLINERKTLEKQMDIQAKQNQEKKEFDQKTILRFMEYLENLDKNINMLTEQISHLEKSLDSFSNNPDEIDSHLANGELTQK